MWHSIHGEVFSWSCWRFVQNSPVQIAAWGWTQNGRCSHLELQNQCTSLTPLPWAPANIPSTCARTLAIDRQALSLVWLIGACVLWRLMWHGPCQCTCTSQNHIIFEQLLVIYFTRNTILCEYYLAYTCCRAWSYINEWLCFIYFRWFYSNLYERK